MKNAVLVLGKGPAARETLKILEKHFPEVTPLVCGYKSTGKSVGIELTLGTEIEQLRAFTKDFTVVGVINRFDSYIQLWGQIVDSFTLPGSSHKAVSIFRSKAETHTLMHRLGLERFRPKTEICEFKDLEKKATNRKFPYVIKPAVGAKSRGVFIIEKPEDFAIAQKYLKKHFKSVYFKRTGITEKIVLIEDFMDGIQVTPTCFIDENGEYHNLGFVDVLNGRNLGESHQQLLYRTTPSLQSKEIKSTIDAIVTKLAKASGLRSTFLHPDFMVENGIPKLMEINVRIGGFRVEMMKYAANVNLAKMAVDLALGLPVDPSITLKNGCTFVEVWETQSGVVEQIVPPKDSHIKKMRLMVDLGESYIAPPQANLPLAQYFVLADKEKCFFLAKNLREKFQIFFT